MSHNGDLSPSLLFAVRRGDTAAARALWLNLAPRLTAYARAIIRRRGTHHDADDIVQAVFCRILTLDDPDLASVREVGPWLAQITRHTALNWLRSRHRDSARTARHSPPAPASSTTADPALASAVDALPARLREVVVLKHIAGLTFDQIELATGINRNTAAARYRSALALLRASLDSAVHTQRATASSPAAALPRPNLVQHA
jgi:RNA polymerase sigma-70 factor (ECF subfamily)